MATKKQVEARCKELGVEFVYDPPMTIGITAPNGYHFEAEAYGWHYADFPANGSWGPRAEVYDALLECMELGLGKCEPGCECLWDHPEEWDA